MAKAVILHTIENAKHCLQHGLHKDAKLFSANVNVVYYLRYKCGMECEDICTNIEPSDYQRIQEITLQICNVLLKELDKKIAPLLNGQLNLSIQYFQPLYSYSAAMQLSLFVILSRLLVRLLDQYSFDTILVYEGVMGPLNIGMELFFARLFSHVQVQIIHHKNRKQGKINVIAGIGIHEISESLWRYDNSQLTKITLKKQDLLAKNILVFEPLSKLHFLNDLKDINIYRYNSGAFQTTIERNYILEDNVFPEIKDLEDFCGIQSDFREKVGLLYEVIRTDFCENIIQYLRITHFYRTLHERENIKTVYWENPPIQGSVALVLEYFMKRRETQVLGVQSKATFWVGKMTNPYASVSVFNRCHFYLTSESTRKDVEELYQDIEEKANLVAYCAQQDSDKKEVVLSNERQSVDVAFYFRLTFSMLQTGYLSANTEEQKSLFDLLGSMSNIKIHFLTPDNQQLDNCAMASVIAGTANVTVMERVKIDDYFLSYKPKLILMDSPQPFLKDILKEDSFIVILKDPKVRFATNLLETLKDRVHFVDSIIEARDILRMYFDGDIKPKLDSTASQGKYGRFRLSGKTLKEIVADHI